MVSKKNKPSAPTSSKVGRGEENPKATTGPTGRFTQLPEKRPELKIAWGADKPLNIEDILVRDWKRNKWHRTYDEVENALFAREFTPTPRLNTPGSGRPDADKHRNRILTAVEEVLDIWHHDLEIIFQGSSWRDSPPGNPEHATSSCVIERNLDYISKLLDGGGLMGWQKLVQETSTPPANLFDYGYRWHFLYPWLRFVSSDDSEGVKLERVLDNLSQNIHQVDPEQYLTLDRSSVLALFFTQKLLTQLGHPKVAEALHRGYQPPPEGICDDRPRLSRTEYAVEFGIDLARAAMEEAIQKSGNADALAARPLPNFTEKGRFQFSKDFKKIYYEGTIVCDYTKTCFLVKLLEHLFWMQSQSYRGGKYAKVSDIDSEKKAKKLTRILKDVKNPNHKEVIKRIIISEDEQVSEPRYKLNPAYRYSIKS